MALEGLSGKVALVTGGAQGIGAATVRRLLAEGMRVVSADVQPSRHEGDRWLGVEADLATEAGAAAMVEAAVTRFGGVHALVTCAGIRGTALPIHELPGADFDAVMTVNVRGMFLSMAAAIRQMLAQKSGGAIVNISSLNARRANPGRVAYNSSKHAVIGLTNTAAVEYGPDGIRVNAILPGSVNTGMSALADQTCSAAGWRMDYTQRPIPRTADPAEIAGFIAWLLSDGASFQTGGAYEIDGGATI